MLQLCVDTSSMAMIASASSLLMLSSRGKGIVHRDIKAPNCLLLLPTGLDARQAVKLSNLAKLRRQCCFATRAFIIISSLLTHLFCRCRVPSRFLPKTGHALPRLRTDRDFFCDVGSCYLHDAPKKQVHMCSKHVNLPQARCPTLPYLTSLAVPRLPLHSQGTPKGDRRSKHVRAVKQSQAWKTNTNHRTSTVPTNLRARATDVRHDAHHCSALSGARYCPPL